MSKIFFYDEVPIIFKEGMPAHSVYGLKQLSDEGKISLSSKFSDLREASSIIILKPILSLKIKLFYPNSKIILINVNSNHILSKKRDPISSFLVKTAYSFCDKIVCLSSIQKEFLEKIGVGDKIEVVRMGIDMQFVKSAKVKKGNYYFTAGKDSGRCFDRVINSIGKKKLVIISPSFSNNKKNKNIYCYSSLPYSKYVSILASSKGLILDIDNGENSSDCSGSITCLEAILLKKPVFINNQTWLSDLLPKNYFIYSTDKELIKLLSVKINFSNKTLPEWVDLEFFKKKLISFC